jgi:hypothetical protein
MMVLVMLPFEWSIVLKTRPPYLGGSVNIMVSLGGMNLYCDL